MRAYFPALFLLVPVAIAAACGGSSSPSSNDAGGGGDAPTVRFALTGDAVPSFLDVPFPSDVYLANGKIIDPLPGVEAVFKTSGAAAMLSHELGKAHGFGRIAMSLFYVDDPKAKITDYEEAIGHADVDPASLPVDEAACVGDASAVYFVDLQETDPTKARIPCRSAYHDDTHHLSKTRPMLAVGPARGIVLAEGHKYAAVITSRVKTKDGRALGASGAFAKIAGGTREGAFGALYGGAFDSLASTLKSALDTDHATIIGIAPYTTNDQTKDLFTLRDAIEDQPAAKLAWDAATMAPMGAVKFARPQNGALPAGFTASLDDWLGVTTEKLDDGSDNPSADLPVRAHDKIDAAGTAVFEAVNYLVSKPGGYPTIDHATFTYDAAGNIVPAADHPTAKIWVTMFTPTSPMPATGYPTIIVQHGLNGSRAYLFELANVLANKGWMTVGIDSVTFGARAPEPSFQVDAASDYSSAPGAKYSGPDGISDLVKGTRNGSGDLFGGLQNIGSIRDQFRQSAIDFVQLVKLLRSDPDLSPLKTGDTVPKIDRDRIALMGDSLGALQDSMGAALEPSVTTLFLNVGGGGLFTEIAAHSPAISYLLSSAGGLFFGFTGDYFSESQVFVTMCQHIVDAGDPLSYAPYLIKSPGALKGVTNKKKNILQTQVLWDEIVGNEGNESFIRAAGIPLATPNFGSNAGILDLKNPSTNPNRLPLVETNPDSNGVFQNVPESGITALVVQFSPASHGSNLVSQTGGHQFAIPFARFDTSAPFTRLDDKQQFDVKEDFLTEQSMMTTFFDESFQGKVPTVRGLKAPVRDYDEDGATDDIDSDPANPNVK